MSQENVEIVRRAYESFNRWAAQPLVEPFSNPEVEMLLHPEVEFHTYPKSPEGCIAVGTARCQVGHAAVRFSGEGS